MPRKSEKNPVQTIRNALAGKKSEELDFIRYEATGDDPRPYIEVPEGAEVESCQNAYTDSLGAVYDVDGEEGPYVAVMVLVVQGPSPEAAAAALVQDAGDVATHLFGALAIGAGEVKP